MIKAWDRLRTHVVILFCSVGTFFSIASGANEMVALKGFLKYEASRCSVVDSDPNHNHSAFYLDSSTCAKNRRLNEAFVTVRGIVLPCQDAKLSLARQQCLKASGVELSLYDPLGVE